MTIEIGPNLAAILGAVVRRPGHSWRPGDRLLGSRSGDQVEQAVSQELRDDQCQKVRFELVLRTIHFCGLPPDHPEPHRCLDCGREWISGRPGLLPQRSEVK